MSIVIALMDRNDGKSAYNWIFNGMRVVFGVIMIESDHSRRALLHSSNVDKIERWRL